VHVCNSDLRPPHSLLRTDVGYDGTADPTDDEADASAAVKVIDAALSVKARDDTILDIEARLSRHATMKRRCTVRLFDFLFPVFSF